MTVSTLPFIAMPPADLAAAPAPAAPGTDQGFEALLALMMPGAGDASFLGESAPAATAEPEPSDNEALPVAFGLVLPAPPPPPPLSLVPLVGGEPAGLIGTPNAVPAGPSAEASVLADLAFAVRITESGAESTVVPQGGSTADAAQASAGELAKPLPLPETLAATRTPDAQVQAPPAQAEAPKASASRPEPPAATVTPAEAAPQPPARMAAPAQVERLASMPVTRETPRLAPLQARSNAPGGEARLSAVPAVVSEPVPEATATAAASAVVEVEAPAPAAAVPASPDAPDSGDNKTAQTPAPAAALTPDQDQDEAPTTEPAAPKMNAPRSAAPEPHRTASAERTEEAPALQPQPARAASPHTPLAAHPELRFSAPQSARTADIAPPPAPATIEAPAPAESKPPASAVREISLSVEAPRQDGVAPAKVELRIAERAGDVHVAVRTPDPEVRQALRTELGSLVDRLERTGYRAEVWQPAERVTEAQQTLRGETHSGSQESREWNFQDGRQQQRRNPNPQPSQPGQPARRGESRSSFRDFLR